MNAPKLRAPRGFSLIEILLVIGVIAVLALAAFVVYPQVSRAMRIQKEVRFVSSAVAELRATFPNGNYQAVRTYWNQQVAAGKPWATSPNGWNWVVMGAESPGSECNTGVCQRIWFQHYYRDGIGVVGLMDEAECEGVTMALSRQFQVRSMNRAGKITPYDFNSARSYCDHEGPLDPLFLSFFTP